MDKKRITNQEPSLHNFWYQRNEHKFNDPATKQPKKLGERFYVVCNAKTRRMDYDEVDFYTEDQLRDLEQKVTANNIRTRYDRDLTEQSIAWIDARKINQRVIVLMATLRNPTFKPTI